MTSNSNLTFNKKSPFILVDGSSYLFRAFHAMPPLTTSKGYPTGAIFGVINMIGKLLEQYQPERIGIIFDAKGKNFRHKLYADYKANRPPMPEELAMQIEPIKKIVSALGLPLLVVDGVEADDVIGTLAYQATDLAQDTLISTGDKDISQLVNSHITLINTMTDTLMTPEGVLKKFGVYPEQIVDYLALIGDSSDNIPGIPKVGPKTATKWLQQYKNIDNILHNKNEIKGKVGELLRENIEQLLLSRKLTTIRTNCNLEFQVNEMKRQNPNMPLLQELFNEYELRSWLKQVIDGNIPFSKSTGRKAHSETQTVKRSDTNIKNNTYETILSTKKFFEWLEILAKSSIFAIDTETTSLNEMTASIVGLSFAVEIEGKQNRAAYLPLQHSYDDVPQQLSTELVLSKLKPILESDSIIKIGQNIKYDWHILYRYGITLKGVLFDTMLESYCVNSGNRHNMDDLALRYLNRNTIHFEDVAGKGAKQKTFDKVEIKVAAPYAAEDADITLRLHQKLFPKLQAEPTLLKVFIEIEMPLLSVLAKMEHTGVLIDCELLLKQSMDLEQKLHTLEQQTYLLTGEEFNLNSSKQLKEILFERLKLPVIKKTPKGQPSTAEPVLSELAQQGHELPKYILEYRSLAKLKSTYTDPLPKQVNANTSRIHTHYQQAVATTGRLSSTNPNLQNIPIRSVEGRAIRKSFIAPEGYKLVAGDYSQIELRIMAHISEDEGLINAFLTGQDVHKSTAAEIFAVGFDKVTTDMRRSAKAVNFGLIYGMSAFGLGKQLGIPRNVAQDYIELYFSRYPKILSYMEEIKTIAHQQGYVETLIGRRLYLPEINSKNTQLRQYAERSAINAPLQGTAADIIKLSMIHVQHYIEQQPYDVKMLMQVHDELVFEVENAHIEHVVSKIKNIMEQSFKLKVPLSVDIGFGSNWDQAH